MLIERLEQATGPDREIDLAIHIAVEPDGEIAKIVASHPRGFKSREGIEWEFTGSQQTLCWHRHDASGHCWSNGGLPMPHYTSSLDGAMALMSAGTEYEISTIYSEAVVSLPLNSDHCQTVRRKDGNVILAFVECCLRARP